MACPRKRLLCDVKKISALWVQPNQVEIEYCWTSIVLCWGPIGIGTYWYPGIVYQEFTWNEYLLVIVDRFTKLVKKISLKGHPAAEVAISSINGFSITAHPRTSSRTTASALARSSSRACAGLLGFTTTLKSYTTPKRIGKLRGITEQTYLRFTRMWQTILGTGTCTPTHSNMRTTASRK